MKRDLSALVVFAKILDGCDDEEKLNSKETCEQYTMAHSIQTEKETISLRLRSMSQAKTHVGTQSIANNAWERIRLLAKKFRNPTSCLKDFVNATSQLAKCMNNVDAPDWDESFDAVATIFESDSLSPIVKQLADLAAGCVRADAATYEETCKTIRGSELAITSFLNKLFGENACCVDLLKELTQHGTITGAGWAGAPSGKKRSESDDSDAEEKVAGEVDTHGRPEKAVQEQSEALDLATYLVEALADMEIALRKNGARLPELHSRMDCVNKTFKLLNESTSYEKPVAALTEWVAVLSTYDDFCPEPLDTVETSGEHGHIDSMLEHLNRFSPVEALAAFLNTVLKKKKDKNVDEFLRVCTMYFASDKTHPRIKKTVAQFEAWHLVQKTVIDIQKGDLVGIKDTADALKLISQVGLVNATDVAPDSERTKMIAAVQKEFDNGLKSFLAKSDTKKFMSARNKFTLVMHAIEQWNFEDATYILSSTDEQYARVETECLDQWTMKIAVHIRTATHLRETTADPDNEIADRCKALAEVDKLIPETKLRLASMALAQLLARPQQASFYVDLKQRKQYAERLGVQITAMPSSLRTRLAKAEQEQKTQQKDSSKDNDSNKSKRDSSKDNDSGDATTVASTSAVQPRRKLARNKQASQAMYKSSRCTSRVDVQVESMYKSIYIRVHCFCMISSAVSDSEKIR